MEFGNIVAPNVQYCDEQDKEIVSKFSKLYGWFDPGKDKQHAENDLMILVYIQEQMMMKNLS